MSIIYGLKTSNRVLRLSAIYSVDFSDFEIRFIQRALQSLNLFASIARAQYSRRQLRARLARFLFRSLSAKLSVCLFTRQAVDCQAIIRLETSNRVLGIAAKVRVNSVILGALIRIKWRIIVRKLSLQLFDRIAVVTSLERLTRPVTAYCRPFRLFLRRLRRRLRRFARAYFAAAFNHRLEIVPINPLRTVPQISRTVFTAPIMMLNDIARRNILLRHNLAR